MNRTVWYPGHMARGGRKLGELAEKLDLFIEVRDARAPFSTSSPLLPSLSRLRPTLLVLSKKDLADPEGTRAWMAEFAREKESKKTVWAFDLRKDSLDSLRRELSRLRPPHRELRLGVVGIPNVGKSMFLNRLVGKARARVGGIPGITREVGWYRGSGFLTVDSPGILDPHSEPGVHRVLSWLGCAKAEVVGGYEPAAVGLIAFLRTRGLWDTVADAWGLAKDDARGDAPAEIVLEDIGRRLGCLVAGGGVNMELAGRRLVDSFASGKLPPLTLELPRAGGPGPVMGVVEWGRSCRPLGGDER
ncbi:MAG: 50S ribosome-binding GTPase [Synergistaceae bacterium]|jgi:ribosome biogenesis GTPase A|nr:50S ribosome-binding GTPase [Synergistaceae bacterium]